MRSCAGSIVSKTVDLVAVKMDLATKHELLFMVVVVSDEAWPSGQVPTVPAVPNDRNEYSCTLLVGTKEY